MTTYTLTVSTGDLGLGVINGARVTVDRKRTQVTDVFNGQSLSKNSAATNSSGIATILLEPDDGSVYHELKIFDLAGILVYSKIFTMPPQAVAITDLPVQDIITASAAQAVAASVTATAQAVISTEQADIATEKAVLTAADKTQTGLDVAATAADRIQTGQDVIDADLAKDAAQLSETNASNSAAIAAASGRIYVDDTAGLAATTNGQYFYVPQSSPSPALYDLYKNNAGAALYINSYPAKSVFNALFKYNGTDTKIPLVVNASGYLLAWYDITTGCISQIFSTTDTYINAVITEYLTTSPIGKTYSNTALTTIIPIYVDALGNVLIGWDMTNNRQVGVYEQGELAADAALAANTMIGKSYAFDGTGNIVPLVVTLDGQIISGYEKTTGLVVSPESIVIENAPVALPTSHTPAVTDWRMIMWDGESTTVGAYTGTLINTTQPYSNLTFAGGPSSSKSGSIGDNPNTGSSIALIETAYRAETVGSAGAVETPTSATLNYIAERSIVEDGTLASQLVLFGSAAGHSGYTLSQLVWGQAWAQIALDQVSEFAVLAVAASKTKSISCIVLDVTVNDAAAATSQAAYDASLRAFVQGAQTNLKTLTGQSTPVHVFIVAPSTYTLSSAGRAIALAIQAVVKDEPYAWLLPPVYHLPFYSDTIHMTALGYVWKGKVAGKHIKQLINGYKPRALNPISATYKNNTITCKFAIRFKPLVLDRTNIGQVINNGIRAKDDTGDIIISNIKVVNGDSIVMTTNRAPSTNAVLRFALDYSLTGSPNTYNGYLGASTNIRDSYPDIASISGSSCPLFDVCPSAELSIITLGV